MSFAKFNSSLFYELAKKHQLSPREIEVCRTLFLGKTTVKEISTILSISPLTVRNHLDSIYSKFGCKSKTELLIKSINYAQEVYQKWVHYIRPPRVLIVDDESEICELLKAQLEEQYIMVYQADNKQKAMQIIQGQIIDFIICDIVMPHGSGLEILEEVKKIHNLVPRIIFISGHFHDVKELYAKGAIGYFTKPIEIDEVINYLMGYYTNIFCHPMQGLLGPAKNEKTFVIKEVIKVNENQLGLGGLAFYYPQNLDFIVDQCPVELEVEYKGMEYKVIGELVWAKQSEKIQGSYAYGVRYHSLYADEISKLAHFAQMNQVKSFIPALH